MVLQVFNILKNRVNFIFIDKEVNMDYFILLK